MKKPTGTAENMCDQTIAMEIFEQQQAQETLQISQYQSHTLIDFLPDATFAINQEKCVIIWNKAIETMTGIPASEMLGQGNHIYSIPFYGEPCQLLTDLIFQYDLTLEARYLNCHRAGDVITAESHCPALNNHQGAWIFAKAAPIRDAEGRITGAIKIIRDITQQKQAEQALYQNQELLSLFIRYSPIYTFIKSVTPTSSRVLQASENFQQLIGITAQEMVGKTMEELFPTDFAAQITADDWKVCSKGEKLIVEEGFNGRYYTTVKFPIVQGDQIFLAGYSIDITERKQLELALSNALQRLHAHMDNSPLGVIEFDPQLRVMRWSKEAEHLFGWSADEVVGCHPSEIAWNHPDDVIAFITQLSDMIKGELPRIIVRTHHFHRHDYRVDCVWYGSAIYDQTGQLTSLLFLILDITERTRLEAELQKQATTDELTGLVNRRHFMALAEIELKRARRFKCPFAIVSIDLDRLKYVNDTYGHAAGDQALITLAQCGQKTLREIDVWARFGGDEFAVLLPEATREQAHEAIERLCYALAGSSLMLSNDLVILTVSAGIACLIDDDESLDELLKRADQALYRAKAAGRNCIQCSASI
ncbi:sensor domain-containing diguanylate cyclase [Chromatium okenii]|uniref:sensor domain-containing diguanylate cyclase n=1 Tax=Chromatium okenii TaxID=61644 RepID=UPI0026F0B984|nr:sensor domain-containing diguanylate cyclase [Chromatium okenii]MBV5307897.1 diguanylate cyclase [Chromatium okenii]